MLWLLEILYLELVFVEVCVPLLEFVSDFLSLLLKHIDLLDLLLKLGLDYPLIILGLLHLFPIPISVLFYLLLFFFDFLLFLKILLILFLELLSLFGVLLLDLYDFILMVVLHSIELSIIHFLECLACSLWIHILTLYLNHVSLEFSEQFVDRSLVLPLQVLYALLIVFTHLELLLLQLQVVSTLHVQLSLINSLEVFHSGDMVFFHLVHGLLVLVILEILLPSEVFVALFKIFDI